MTKNHFILMIRRYRRHGRGCVLIPGSSSEDISTSNSISRNTIVTSAMIVNHENLEADSYVKFFFNSMSDYYTSIRNSVTLLMDQNGWVSDTTNYNYLFIYQFLNANLEKSPQYFWYANTSAEKILNNYNDNWYPYAINAYNGLISDLEDACFGILIVLRMNKGLFLLSPRFSCHTVTFNAWNDTVAKNDSVKIYQYIPTSLEGQPYTLITNNIYVAVKMNYVHDFKNLGNSIGCIVFYNLTNNTYKLINNIIYNNFPTESSNPLSGTLILSESTFD